MADGATADASRANPRAIDVTCVVVGRGTHRPALGRIFAGLAIPRH